MCLIVTCKRLKDSHQSQLTQAGLLLTAINMSFMREYKIFSLLAEEFIPHKMKSHYTCRRVVFQWEQL
jgi:hypothetical protein